MILTVRLGSPMNNLVEKKEVKLSFPTDKVTIRVLINVICQEYPILTEYFPQRNEDCIFDFILPVVDERTVGLYHILSDGQTVSLYLTFCCG